MLKLTTTALAATSLLLVSGCSVQDSDTETSTAMVTTEEAGSLGIRIGADDAPVRMTLHSDPQCPWCAMFEDKVGDQIQDALDLQSANLTLVLRSFLDGRIGNTVSLQAGNAVLCVQEQTNPLPYFSALMAAQPAQGDPGWDADSLIALADNLDLDAGQLQDVSDCITNKAKNAQVAQMEASGAAAGITSVPTLLINDQQVADGDLMALLEDRLTLADLIEKHAGS